MSKVIFRVKWSWQLWGQETASGAQRLHFASVHITKKGNAQVFTVIALFLLITVGWRSDER